MDRTTSDTQLVEECLQGNATAWATLIDRYKNLIYSVPVRWGFSQADASDIFQSVVAELLSELGRLREPKALPAWLFRVASHKCRQWRHHQLRETVSDERTDSAEDIPSPGPSAESLLQEIAREQILRDALDNAPQRCRDMIRMLFFENPNRTYPEVAASLGIATGSIGFVRRRCLDRLRKYLEENRF